MARREPRSPASPRSGHQEPWEGAAVESSVAAVLRGVCISPCSQPGPAPCSRWRVRQRRAVAAGSGAARRDVAGEGGAQPLVSYGVGISACEKGEQWQMALSLLREMWEAKLEPTVIGYSAGINACQKGEQWQRALALLGEMREAKLEPGVTVYSAEIRACERCGQWRQALLLLGDMRDSSLDPEAASYNWGISACERSSHDCARFPGYPEIGLSRFREFCVRGNVVAAIQSRRLSRRKPL
ncbi:unnamed protein product [Prorocentrum cordatum]|uniref:Pentatricopeptide repeat-containing protein n=1 Tax=Prorocentrum cordatum TaxID=2364126 RepID=A0ABN9VX76_9DINO|nr:unnamed protein product [Polarella glacialis]